MIVIIDYKTGNIASIENMLRKIGVQAYSSRDVSMIANADKLILPGVGAFDQGMENLHEMGIVSMLNDLVIKKKVPILGICLGMQLMTKKSEEGTLRGLSWFDAETVRFRFNESHADLKIPHMGWNTVLFCKKTNLFNGIEQNPRFYFVHSYHVLLKSNEDTLTKTVHGYEFVSAFTRENIVGVQFHPEKSHKYGMHFLSNWVFS